MLVIAHASHHNLVVGRVDELSQRNPVALEGARCLPLVAAADVAPLGPPTCRMVVRCPIATCSLRCCGSPSAGRRVCPLAPDGGVRSCCVQLRTSRAMA